MEPLDSTYRDKLTNPHGPFMKVIHYLENTLRVRPIQGSLTIPPLCDEYTSGANEGKCSVLHSTTECGVFEVPDQYLGTREVCTTSSSTCSEAGPNGSGANNTDFLLFFGAGVKFLKVHSCMDLQ